MTVGELKKQVRSALKGAYDGRTDDEKRLLTTNEFAEMYGYSSSSMRTLLKRNKITGAFKVGNEWFIPEDAYIDVKQYSKKRSTKLIGVDGFLC